MKKWTKEEQREHRMQLAEALVSGKYQQGSTRLRPEIDKFCCLGVAMDLMGCIWNDSIKEADGRTLYYASSGSGGHLGALSFEAVEYYGFNDELGSFRTADGKPAYVDFHPDDQEPHYTPASLASANDQGVTFEKISELLRNDPPFISRRDP